MSKFNWIFNFWIKRYCCQVILTYQLIFISISIISNLTLHWNWILINEIPHIRNTFIFLSHLFFLLDQIQHDLWITTRIVLSIILSYLIFLSLRSTPTLHGLPSHCCLSCRSMVQASLLQKWNFAESARDWSSVWSNCSGRKQMLYPYRSPDTDSTLPNSEVVRCIRYPL